MTKYEVLEQDAYDRGIELYENVYLGNDHVDPDKYLLGVCCGNKIGLAKELCSQCEKASILAEEIAHHEITYGDILDQTVIENRKQELTARCLGYDALFNGIYGIIEGLKAGCENTYELSEYLDVPEKTIVEALGRYRSKYGCRIEFDDFDLQFEPWIAVMCKRKFSDA